MSKQTQARCTKTMLTAGFHSASPPLVWRFDLERNHSFTLSLQGEEGDFELGVTSPKGEFYPVVHFAAREDAEEALMVVEKALSHKRGSASLLTKALAMVGVLALLIGIATVVYGISVQNQIGALSSATQISPATEGVPMSADDVLKSPR